MSTVRVRRKLESEHLYLPELKALIGKTVEITVVEQGATRAGPAVEAESIPTHTSRALTSEAMAQELNAASQPTAQPSVPLKHKVDYNQVL